MPNAAVRGAGSGDAFMLSDLPEWGEDEAATTILLDGVDSVVPLSPAPTRAALPQMFATPQSSALSIGGLTQQGWWLGWMIALVALFGVGWMMDSVLIVPLIASRVSTSRATATTTSALRASSVSRAAEPSLGPVETGFAVDSSPSGASVLVDEVRIAQVTPARITNLSAGSHTLRLAAGSAYHDWTTTLEMASGQVIFLPTIELERATAHRPSGARRGFGALTIHSVPRALAEVDGRRIGYTPRFKVPVSAGYHRVTLSNSKLGMRKALRVRIGPGKTAVLDYHDLAGDPLVK